MLFRSKLRIPEVTLAVLAVGGGCGDDDPPPAPPGDGDGDGGTSHSDGGMRPGPGGAATSGPGTSNQPDAAVPQDAGERDASDDGGVNGCDAFALPSDLVQSLRVLCEAYVPCLQQDGYDDTDEDSCFEYFCVYYTEQQEFDLDDDTCVHALTQLLECDARELEADCEGNLDDACYSYYLDFYNACY